MSAVKRRRARRSATSRNFPPFSRETARETLSAMKIGETGSF